MKSFRITLDVSAPDSVTKRQMQNIAGVIKLKVRTAVTHCSKKTKGHNVLFTTQVLGPVMKVDPLRHTQY